MVALDGRKLAQRVRAVDAAAITEPGSTGTDWTIQMGLGHLPKKDPESCRAWLHGKLFTSMLVERMIGAAKKFSPWGYELDATQERVA